MLGKNKKYLTLQELEERKQKERIRQRLRKKPKKIMGWVNPKKGTTVSIEVKLKNAISQGSGQFFIVKKDNKVMWQGRILSECARLFDLSVGNISECLHGKRKQHKGFIFQFEAING